MKSGESPTNVSHTTRKNDHIEICLNHSLEQNHTKPLLAPTLSPVSIPDFNRNDVSIEQPFLGRTFGAPILITGMTGGVEDGRRINLNLARCASKFNIPMGVGSQRMALENPKLKNLFTVKDDVPDVFLIANLGFSEILSSKDPLDLCKKAVEMIQADALAIHLNVLQELIQPEGNHTQFTGFFEKLAVICRDLTTPVIIKEVGCGLDALTAKRCLDAGACSLDVGGRGGTSWSSIEASRNQNKSLNQRLGQLFTNWGTPTFECIQNLSSLKKERNFPIIATGGMRNGIDVLNALHYGATMVGIGLPFFKSAHKSYEALEDEISFVLEGLRHALVLTNSIDLNEI